MPLSELDMLVAQAIAEQVTANVVEELSERQVFTAEDIALIRDHVKPNGVAFKNGYRAAIEEVEKWCDADPDGSTLAELLERMKER